jgi:hypothetical protein
MTNCSLRLKQQSACLDGVLSTKLECLLYFFRASLMRAGSSLGKIISAGGAGAGD